MPTQTARPQRAFTLIELLTVIAIIGILAAILIPTVGLVRKKAQATDCLSRLRQMGTAIHLYSEDNKGMAPPWRGALTDPNINGSQGVLWTQALIRYMSIKAGDSQGSPVLPDMPVGTDYSKIPHYFYMCPGSLIPVKGRSWGNYAVHPVIMRANAAGPFYKLNRVVRPTQVVLIADGTQNDQGDDAFFSLYGSSSDGSHGYFNKTYVPGTTGDYTTEIDRQNPGRDVAGGVGWLRYRHNNNVNCLFVDGHVGAKPKGSLTLGNVMESR